jgi:hypothetical protein
MSPAGSDVVANFRCESVAIRSYGIRLRRKFETRISSWFRPESMRRRALSSSLRDAAKLAELSTKGRVAFSLGVVFAALG